MRRTVPRPVSHPKTRGSGLVGGRPRGGTLHVPLESLVERTRELAAIVASMDPWAVRLAKRAVNNAVDTMGFSNSINASFDVHHLGHARAIAHTSGRTLIFPISPP